MWRLCVRGFLRVPSDVRGLPYVVSHGNDGEFAEPVAGLAAEKIVVGAGPRSGPTGVRVGPQVRT